MSQARLAFRILLRAPFVTLAAIVSLALGIGATTAVFSLFEQMLLRPLPVAQPGRLVNLGSPGPKQGWVSSNDAGPSEDVFSHAMFRDLEREQTVFAGLAAHRLFDANVGWHGHTEDAEGTLVSGSYFGVLGLRPALGRLLGPEDDHTPGAHDVVVLGHDYWRARFSESPDVLGQTLIVNGRAMAIVGVAPRGFQGTTLGTVPRVFVPIRMSDALLGPWAGLDDRRRHWAYLFARLAPGISREHAQTALNVAYGAVINAVEAPLQSGMSDETMARFRARQVLLSEGARGQSRMHRRAGAPLLLLLGATGLVLLIACANVANLLLARGASRAREMAIRLSLGASRHQLVGQLLLESSLLAALGGLAGLVVARWTLEGIRSMLPADPAASVHSALDLTVLAFAAALALGTGLAFGLFPALEITRPDIAASLHGQAGPPTGSRGAARFRWGLATTQIALSMTLLVTAGLFTKSLANLVRVDLGLETGHLLTFGVSPELNGYAPARSRALFERLEDELAALPGVHDVAAAEVPLIAGSARSSNVTVEGFEAGPDTDTDASFNRIGPGYFRTLGIPLLAGRELTRADTLGSPKVAVVNVAFARKFGLGRGAVGRRMATGRGDVELDIEIVGLVADARYSEVKQAPPPQFFLSYRQDEQLGAVTFYVRSSQAPEELLSAVRRAVSRLDPDLPVEELRTMEAQVRENVSSDRLIRTLSAAFAFLATALAAVGLYGVLAYTVSRRTREFGVRLALGADGPRLRRMVLAQVGWMTVIGVTVGLLAAVALGRLARSLLYELEGHDPAVLAGAAVALGTVALLAGALPARRASRVDPMRALRSE